jgi:hypothetical protein
MGLASETSVHAMTAGRLVCPVHGRLRVPVPRCEVCGKEPYNLDDVDERNMLRSLRNVEVSARTMRARLICYPAVFLGLLSIVGINGVSIFLTPVAGEPLSQLAEQLLRRLQRGPFRAVDAELFKP